MNEKRSNVTVVGLVLLVLAGLTQFAWSIDPKPDGKTLIFPSLIPKSGQTVAADLPDENTSQKIRIAYETTYEKYWKETSYFEYNRDTGIKEHGFYVDSKTYGYSYLPWPLASRGGTFDRPAPFFGSSANLFQRGGIPEAAPAPFTGDLPYGGANPVGDGFWTPGEAFEDLNGNGEWDDEIPPEDYWWVDNYSANRSNSCGDILPAMSAPRASVGLWNGRRGEFYADYDGKTVVDENDDDRRAFQVSFNPSATIYLADVAGGTNRVVQINEMDITPDNCDDLEGDFYHTYVDNGNPGGGADVPQNEQFDFAEDVNERPLVWHAQNSQSGDFVYTTYERFEIGDGDDVRPYTGSTPVDSNTNDVEIVLREVEVPVYQSAMLFNRPLLTISSMNIYGDPFNPADPNAEDGTWTPGTPAELYEDFLSWWDPDAPNDGRWTYLDDPGVDPELIHPLRAAPPGGVPVGQAISLNDYEDYIRWNYPGDADALIANALNGEYDGPQGFEQVGTSQLRRVGFIDDLSTPEPENWDDRWYADWTEWWEALFDSAAPDWLADIPNLQVYSPQLTSGSTGWIPASGSWGYQSPREFCDMPSSIYYLGGSPLNAVNLDANNMNMGIVTLDGEYLGDGGIGEPTSPWSDAIYGQDIGVNNPNSPEDTDDNIVAASPFSFNVHGADGYDAGNLLNLEYMTWRYTAPEVARGLSQAGMDAAVPYPREFRDVNLDGMVDHGRILPHEPNYAGGRNGGSDEGTGAYPYNNERYTQSMIAAWDHAEDFDLSFRWPDASGPQIPMGRPFYFYFYPIYPTTGLNTEDKLGGPAGQNTATLTRDRIDPIMGFLQARPFSGGTIGGSEGIEIEGFGFGMGLLIHEQGHDYLDWPDLYDYDVWTPDAPQQLTSPIAGYDIMSGGLTHGIPDMKATPAIGGPWIDIQDLTAELEQGGGPRTLELYPITRNNDQYYIFQNQLPGREREYFFLWYTDNNTRFPAPGGAGVYISHTDLKSHPNAIPNQQRQDNHFIWEMVQADGLNQLQDGINGGDSGDPFPGSTDKRIWTADTIPSSRWWDQSDSGLRILNVEIPDAPQAPARVTLEWTDPDDSWNNPDSYDSDGDTLPDAWEMHYFGDLNTANASSDFTNDGILDVWYHQLGLDPIESTISYDTVAPGTTETYGELLDDGDDMPFAWELQYASHLDPYRFDAFNDPDMDGWDNLSEYLAGTDPTNDNSLPRPQVNVRVDWDGPTPGTVAWIAWDHPGMDGVAIASGTVQPAVGEGQLAVATGALVQNENYIMFFADLDDSGTWDRGEPGGFPDVMPVDIGWNSVYDVRVGLTLDPVGYSRFFWDDIADPDTGAISRQARVTRNSTVGEPQIFIRQIEGRNIVHEYDFKDMGGLNVHGAAPYELPVGTSAYPGYNFFVGDEIQPRTTAILDWRDPLSAPEPVWPLGIVSFTERPFVWSHEGGESSRFILEIRETDPNGAVVAFQTISAPVPRNDGTYAVKLSSLDTPLFIGAEPLDPGLYVWRVTADNPAQSSAVSDWKEFSVDTTSKSGGPYEIRGDFWYMGRGDVASAEFIIQASKSPSFSGEPIQQVSLPSPSIWRLPGLDAGDYYIRGFMDVNGNGEYEQWEPYGFLKNPGAYAADYEVKKVSVGLNDGDGSDTIISANSTGNLIVLHDVDVDNDDFADVWEWQTYEEFDTVGPDYVGNYSDHSSILLTAMADMLPFDLTKSTIGDGVSDVMKIVLGYTILDTPPASTLLAINNINLIGGRISFDMVAGLPPLVRPIRVQVQYSYNLINWSDSPDPGATKEVGPGSGEWFIYPGKSESNVYYRLRWEPLR